MSDASVARTVERLTEQGIDVVRIGYPDLIGTERGRDILVERLPEVMEHGVAFCRAVYHTSPRATWSRWPAASTQACPTSA